MIADQWSVLYEEWHHCGEEECRLIGHDRMATLAVDIQFPDAAA